MTSLLPNQFLITHHVQRSQSIYRSANSRNYYLYCPIIIMLRLSGKRTLAKWNSCDYVVTILLLCRGEMQRNIMKRERVAEREILAALRAGGVSAVEEF